uniref:Replication-associated protein n=1 Tax=Cressdnaviricota sp. TaxID=2748378 RepID=A0A6M3YPH7_9VIRU|nr:MAG: hypothetical protein [Cressdnaviricota sp.]
MGILSIVLRGISGVGKSVLTHYLERVLHKLGKRVAVISKDAYRTYLNEREGYHYTKEEERRVTEWYRETYRRTAERDDLDYIICDNTHTREEEVLIPCTLTGNVEKAVVIFVGNNTSRTNSSVPEEVIERQRSELEETTPLMINLYAGGAIEWFVIPPRSSDENVAREMIEEFEIIKQECI